MKRQPNDINKLRQQSLFQPTPDITMGDMGVYQPTPTYPQQGVMDPRVPTESVRDVQQNIPVPQAPAPPEVNPRNMMSMWEQVNKIYTPETTARDRFGDLLDAPPQMEEPGWGRKLVAGGMGWGVKDPNESIKAMESVMYAPYHREMADWTARADPYHKAAQLENTANINERTLAGNILTAETQANRLADQTRIADEKNRIQEQKNIDQAEIGRLRAYAAQLAAQGRNVQWDTSGPTVLIREGNQVKDTGIDTKKLSDFDKINLQGQWNVTAARERGAEAMNRVIAGGAEYLQDGNGNLIRVNPREQGAEPPTGGPFNTVGAPARAGTENAAVMKERRQQQLRNVYENYPQYQHLFKDVGGVLQLEERPTASWRTSAAEEKRAMEEWDALNKLINPGYNPPAGVGPSTAPAPEPEKKPAIGPTRTPTPRVAQAPKGSAPTNKPAAPISSVIPRTTPQPPKSAPGYVPPAKAAPKATPGVERGIR